MTDMARPLPSHWVMHRRLWGAGLIALTITLAPACDKTDGATCYSAEECAEGLACLGDGGLNRCESCEAHALCGDEGRCSASEGRCVAASDDDCKRGYICKGKGGCTAKDGVCTVGGDADCKQSEACVNDGFCHAKGNNCVKVAAKEAEAG